MGNDPIAFAMSGQRSTTELISNFEHPTRFELVSLGYKSRIIDQLYEGCVYLFLSTWRDSNPRDWVCKPVPSVFLLHSTTGAYFNLSFISNLSVILNLLNLNKSSLKKPRDNNSLSSLSSK